MTAERQTQTHLMQLFAAQRLKPRHDLGQNFLIDLNLLELIVQEAELGPEDVVLEVGAGTGSLTALMAPVVGQLISVEYDHNLHALAAAAVSNVPHAQVIQGDVLRNKSHLADNVMAALSTALADSTKALKLVANLPYHVATPVIANLMASDFRWSRMVVTIQYELGERMMAAPSTPDYSALSVWLQAQANISLVRKLPASVFWPRPKVDSAIMRLDPAPERAALIHNRPAFHHFIRDLFTLRRKSLRRVLIGQYGKQLGDQGIDEILRSLALADSARAEELAPERLVALSNQLHAALAAAASNGTNPLTT